MYRRFHGCEVAEYFTCDSLLRVDQSGSGAIDTFKARGHRVTSRSARRCKSRGATVNRSSTDLSHACVNPSSYLQKQQYAVYERLDGIFQEAERFSEEPSKNFEDIYRRHRELEVGLDRDFRVLAYGQRDEA